jgi:uncharacterized membrane protein
MAELVDGLKISLDSAGELVEVVLNAISLIFIVVGVFVSVSKSIAKKRTLPKDYPLHIYFRQAFGGWLVVALEFQLAADIVATIVSPTYEHLIQVGVVAVIRTFLNYFLNKELTEERELSKKVASETK